MEYVVKFIGKIETNSQEEAEKTMFSILKKLDEHFEEYSASLEESEDEKMYREVFYE